MKNFISFGDFLRDKGVDVDDSNYQYKRKKYLKEEGEDENIPDSDVPDEDDDFEGGMEPDFDEEPEEQDIPELNPASENNGLKMKAKSPEKLLKSLQDNGIIIVKSDEKSFLKNKEIEASYGEKFFRILANQINTNSYETILPKDVRFKKNDISAKTVDEIIDKLASKKIEIDEDQLVDFRNNEPVSANIEGKEFLIQLEKKAGRLNVHIPEKIMKV